jgi:hypothetical protein
MSSAPNPPPDDRVWRDRFIMINLTRIGGTIIVLVGLYLWQTDRVREGGAIEIGLPLAAIGLAISFLGPMYLARKWRTPPGQ